MRQRLGEITGLQAGHGNPAAASEPAGSGDDYTSYYDTSPGLPESMRQEERGRRPVAEKPRSSWPKSQAGREVSCRTADPDRSAHIAAKAQPWPARSQRKRQPFCRRRRHLCATAGRPFGSTAKNPGQSALQLMARWHGTEQGRLLRALAEKEWLIDADNLEQQFFDTIASLSTPT